MTVASNAPIARRPLLLGVLALAGVAVLGSLTLEMRALFKPRYAATPFDDLLSKLPDRESAVKIGAVLAQEHKPFDTRLAASRLRARLNSRTLAEVLDSELAQGRTVEARGWVLPESLATLCVLAAKSA